MLLSQSNQQFADIINRLAFHSLNFDKNFVKYFKKTQKKIYLSLKIEKKREMTVKDFLKLVFFQLIQRKYLTVHYLNQRVNPKTC